MTLFYFYIKSLRLNTIGVLFIIILFFSYSSCSSRKEPKYNSDVVANQFYFIGNISDINDNVKLLVEKSGICKGGFVLILNTFSSIKNSNIDQIKNAFYNQQVMAIHNFTLHSDSVLKNTDVIGIENASIIIISCINNNDFMAFANNTDLANVIIVSIKNGSLFSGIDSCTSVIGEYYSKKINKY